MFKSIKFGILAIVLLGTTAISKAQKAINSGTITYGIEYILTDEQKKEIDAALLPSESKVEFNGNISKVQVDLGMAMLKVLTDGVASNAVVLVDIPMIQKQYAAKMSKTDVEEQRGALKFSGFKATGETQNIAGFNAEKYSYQDQNGQKYELWATNELKLPAGANPPGFDNFKSTPIKFQNVQDGYKTRLTLKNIKEGNVGPFSLDIPQGYEIKTVAELKAMRGGN